VAGRSDSGEAGSETHRMVGRAAEVRPAPETTPVERQQRLDELGFVWRAARTTSSA